MDNFQNLLATAEYRNNRLPVEVPLLWLIQNAESSCDGYYLGNFEGWVQMFAEKTSDTGFGYLVDSLMERGFMPEGSIGFSNGNITEGHHRLCAAILLGLETVWVSAWGGNVLKPGHNYVNLVCAHDNENYDDGTTLPEYPIAIHLVS